MQSNPIWPPVMWPAKATEVPKDIFVRQDIFEEEMRVIFHGPEWFPVAHVSEVPNIDDFKAAVVGDVPLLVTRDPEGQVHVLYNSCSHRGAQVETRPFGNKRLFQCSYHRWSFNAKGDLVGCTLQPGDSVNFEREKFPMKKPRMGIVHGLVFVTLSDEAPSLEVFLDGYEDKLSNVMGGDGKLKLLGYHKSLLQANWKTYHDNDGWHAPLLHTAFRLLNWQGGKGRQFANDRGHRGFESPLTVPDGRTILADPSLIDFKVAPGKDSDAGSCSLHLFPLFAAVKHLNTIGLRFVNPRSVDETELIFAYFGREEDSEEMLAHRVRQGSNLLGPCGMVSMEDAAMFHRLHIGSRTPGMQVFQKGVKDEYDAHPSEFSQNDESPNILSWEYYREIMGFEKASKA